MGMLQIMTESSSSSSTTPARKARAVVMTSSSVTRRRKQALQIPTTILLSLFLPLSFLLLARISTARHFSTILPFKSDDFWFLFLSANSVILYILVYSVSIAAFLHALTQPLLTRQQPPRDDSDGDLQPGNPGRGGASLYLCWVLVCSVGLELGLEFQLSETISMRGINTSGNPRGLLLAVGLHETMQYWSKAVVKPVVEDSFGGSGEEEVIRMRWVEKAGMGLSFGGLWWWRLRGQVYSLAAVGEAEAEADEFVNWWLYHLIVGIGATRVLRGVVWVAKRKTHAADDANQGARRRGSV